MNSAQIIPSAPAAWRLRLISGTIRRFTAIDVSMPQTINSAVHHELLIKKSRFIACVQPMPDRASAQKVVAELWEQHPGAAHVCWALLAGGQSAAVDDGEPSGTAGRPMLDVLRHQDLEGVLATVVRYFGGVKLGAGGLVRAYTDSVAQTLLKAEKIAIIKQRQLICSAPYAMEGLLRREIELAGANLDNVQHADEVLFTFSLPDSAADELIIRLNESGHGRIAWITPDDATDTD
jgi:uncharacterized YigZ family protein